MLNVRSLLYFLIAAVFVPGAVMAIDTGGDDDFPACTTSFCNGSVARCHEICRKSNGSLSACVAFLSDYDGDGVPNSSDNCYCHSNANQANCDGDSLGDVCDPTDNSWYQVSTSLVTCHVDVDEHALWDTMEMWGGNLYKSRCTGATCTKKHLQTAFNCYLPSGATEECCLRNWTLTACRGAWDFDNCGTPRCTF